MERLEVVITKYRISGQLPWLLMNEGSKWADYETGSIAANSSWGSAWKGNSYNECLVK